MSEGALLRAFALTAGRAALQRSLPLYLGVLVALGVLFEGNGVQPADLVGRAQTSWPSYGLMYASWTVMSLPAVSALLTAPSSFFLRALPVARGKLLMVTGMAVSAAQWPWTYLWWRGAGIEAGLAATASAVAFSSLVVSRMERPRERCSAVLLLAAHGLPYVTGHQAEARWLPVLVIAAPAAVVGVQGAWQRAPERTARPGSAPLAGPPLRALSITYAVLLWRNARSQLLRGIGIAALASGAGYLSLINTRHTSPHQLISLTSGWLTCSLVASLATLVGPLLACEARLRWLFLLCGTSPTTNWASKIAPLLLYVIGVAFAHTLFIVWSLELSRITSLQLLLVDVVAASLLAVIVLTIAPWALRGNNRDATRLLVAMGALLSLSLFTLALWHAWALVAWALATPVVAWIARRGSPSAKQLASEARQPS